jgi:hypothetical protein
MNDHVSSLGTRKTTLSSHSILAAAALHPCFLLILLLYILLHDSKQSKHSDARRSCTAIRSRAVPITPATLPSKQLTMWSSSSKLSKERYKNFFEFQTYINCISIILTCSHSFHGHYSIFSTSAADSQFRHFASILKDVFVILVCPSHGAGVDSLAESGVGIFDQTYSY